MGPMTTADHPELGWSGLLHDCNFNSVPLLGQVDRDVVSVYLYRSENSERYGVINIFFADDIDTIELPDYRAFVRFLSELMPEYRLIHKNLSQIKAA